MPDPSDQEVSEFVKAHPGGATIHEVAAIFQVTNQRIQQLEARAVAKLARELRWRKIYNVGDVVDPLDDGATWM